MDSSFGAEEEMELEEEEEEEEFGNIFSRAVNSSSKAKTIKTIEVRKMVMSGIEVVVMLMDESKTTYSFPVHDKKDYPFILFYGNKVVPPPLLGYDPLNQEAIDGILDRLLNEASDNSRLDMDSLMKLGRKVNWAVSAAVCKAAAYSKNISLYEHIAALARSQNPEFCSDFRITTPAFNITNGVLHPPNQLACQHLVVLPLRAFSFRQSCKIIEKLYDRYFKKAIDMGSKEHEVLYTPCTKDIKNCCESLKLIIADLGYTKKVSVGLYIGASKLYGPDRTYSFNFKEKKLFWLQKNEESPSLKTSGVSRKDVYDALVRELGVTSYEDLFDLVDKEYLEVDQIGSVTKCIEFVLECRDKEWDVVMSSHYSCPLSDDFIADFCVALDMVTYKIGISCIDSDCKIRNRLREIEVSRVDATISMYQIAWGRFYDHLRTRPLKDGEDCTILADIVSGRMTKEQYKEMQMKIIRDGE